MQDLPTQLYGRGALAFSAGPTFAHSLLRADVPRHREIGRPQATDISVDPLLLAPTASDLTGDGKRRFKGGPSFTQSFRVGSPAPPPENQPRAHSCKLIATDPPLLIPF